MLCPYWLCFISCNILCNIWDSNFKICQIPNCRIWYNGQKTHIAFSMFPIQVKKFSEALTLASTNPQYDKRLFIELQVQCMEIPSSEHVVYINCSECQNKNEQSFVILWVSWYKNKCFWKRFACKWYIFLKL